MNITQITPEAIELSMRLHPNTPNDVAVTESMMDSEAILDLVRDGVEMANAGMPASVIIASMLTSGVRLGWYMRDDATTMADVTALLGVTEEEIQASIRS